MEWQEQVDVATTYIAVLDGGLQLRLLKTRGTCKEGCAKWQVFCPPFITRPALLEVVEDDVEAAKFAALQLIRAHLTKLISSVGEIK